MIASPLIGFVLAYLLMIAILWIFRHRNPEKLSKGFRWAQIGPLPVISCCDHCCCDHSRSR